MKTRNIVHGIYATLLGASLILGIGSATALAQSSTLVVGTNTYPADVIAVQAAVDNFQEVTLSGTFNFGTATPPSIQAGIVYLRKADTVLKAASTGATINGGGKSHPRLIQWCVLAVEAPGVTIRGLTLSGSPGTGILVTTRVSNGSASNYYQAPQLVGNPVTIENNTINTGIYCVLVYYPGAWPVMIRNNSGTASNLVYVTGAGYVYRGTLPTPIEHVVDVAGQPIMGALDILDNHFEQTTPLGNLDGITVQGWFVTSSTNYPAMYNLPDWGDNGPVTIARNTLVMSGGLTTYTSGIAVGRTTAGLNHCAILDNTISGGTTLCGIAMYPYGRDNMIAGNDLVNLSTGFGVVTFAGETSIAENKLGASILFYPVALVSCQMMTTLPMPLPVENCVVMDNDYTLTGRSEGCVILAANQDAGIQPNNLGQCIGVEVRNNLIKETPQSFPSGAGGIHLANQIVLFPTNGGVGPQNTHDNRVVGLRADECADHSVGDRIKAAFGPGANWLNEITEPVP